MAKKVHALYDFEGQPGTGELTICSGDVLTVTRTDVGEGWWEGTNARGESGLFPEAYVEDYSDDEGPPSMAPPPLPPDCGGGGGSGGWAEPPPMSTPAASAAATAAPPAAAAAAADADDDWGNGGWGRPEQQQQQQTGQQQDDWATDFQAGSSSTTAPEASKASAANTNQAYDQDDWDSDFDDDNNGVGPGINAGGSSGGMLNVPKNTATTGSSGDVSSIGRADSKKQSTSGRTSFNRFSTFVKSGGENYVLGKLNAKVQESDVVQIVDNGDGRYSWLNAKPPYSCAIASPKKESKLKGLKSFIAYQLTPSFNNIQVSRRYKHFDWLHERLVEKYTLIPIPPLPDKQIQGRYEGEFIEHRMNQLQSFVDRVCGHPILSQSEVWQHFLTCTDEKRWKNGKRKAEKDPLVGGSFFMAIRTPEKVLDSSFVDHEVEVFTRFTTYFDSAVKNMLKTAADQTTKCQTHYKREFQTIGKSFQQLGQALEQDGNYQNSNLTNAITCTGEAYEEIGKMYEDQPRNDWEHLGDMMHDYRGTLAGWPGILQVHAGALGKRKEFDRLAAEGKVGQGEATEIGNRTDTLSYAMLGEINTFHQQRITDMKTCHQDFLKEQIVFYQKIIEKLQDSLRMFDNC